MGTATTREVELDEARALNDLLADRNRERLVARVKLTRLRREQAEALLAAMFAEPITPEFLDGIYRETEGNPFFIEEVCKTLIEDGTLVRENGRWRRSAMSEIRVPQSVRVAIQSRVAKLPSLPRRRCAWPRPRPRVRLCHPAARRRPERRGPHRRAGTG